MSFRHEFQIKVPYGMKGKKAMDLKAGGRITGSGDILRLKKDLFCTTFSRININRQYDGQR